ncbi:regulator of G-protein signaling 9-binding protein B-like [Anguilla anguilla]|uniref:regulator of G-protein signaling 9-binding protein B-like n=1 Tax=Anguilla anguilla TaxID=7936 RepID=UPI0015AA6C0B|nr:regulator of G-protein signaling 9-binding protein B-like [Anguilla anguilla]
MLLSINKVGADDNAGSPQSLDDGKTLVDSLMKVVACYRQLSSCVGGCTDSVDLRHQLRRTRERAQELATANRQCLTTRLRDKRLPEEERREAELLWVAFSSCLELLHADMCKVFNIGQSFSLSDRVKTFVQTGIQGETSEMTARALSLRDLNHNEAPSSVERLEQGDLEAEIAQVDQMIEDMEQKVNVLRWTVEASGPQYADPLSADSASLALLSGDEEDPGRCCDRSQVFAVSLLCGTAVAAALMSVLSVCAVYMM